MENEKTLDELRQMSKSELAKYFGMQEKISKHLVTALKPGYFEILIDNNLTLPEMAEKLDVCWGTANQYRFALIKAGFAKKKLEHGAKIPLDQNYNLILSALDMPMNYEELKEKTGLESYYLYRDVSNLKKQNVIHTFMLSKHAGVPRTCSAFDLFGDLAGKLYLYKPTKEHEIAVAELLISYLPSPEDIRHKGWGKTLTSILRNRLSAGIFPLVYSYYAADASFKYSNYARYLKLAKIQKAEALKAN